MSVRAALLALSLAVATAAAGAAPRLLPLQVLPGDDAIGPAWGDQSDPDIAAGGGAFLAVWSDARALEGKWDIWGIRLGADGTPLEPVAFVIDDVDGSQVTPRVAWNGTDWLVAWLDEGKVTAVRVSAAGTVLGPKVVAGTPGDSAALALASDGASWVVAWAGTSAGNADVRAARIGSDGSLVDPGGLVIVPETFFMRLGLTLAFADGAYLLAWPEYASDTDNDIVGIRFGTDLVPLHPAPFTIAATPNADITPALASNGTSYCLVWKESDRSGWVNGISSSLVAADGTAAAPLGVPVGDRRSWGENPDVAWDGTQWIAAWTALGAEAARIAADGTVLDAAGIPVAPSTDFDVRDVAVAGVPGGGARAVFVDYRSHRENDIGGAGLTRGGAALPENVVSLSIPSQQHAQLAWNGTGYLVAFESLTSLGSRILVQRVGADFAPIDAEPVEVAAGDVIEPGLAWSGDRYLVTWKNVAASRIEARRLAADLTFQDAAPIDVMVGDNPSVAALGDVFLVTVDHSPSYWQWRDVYGQRIDGATGTRLGGLIQLVGGFAWGSTVGAIGSRWAVAWEAHQAQNDTIFTIALAFVDASGATASSTGLAMGSGWGVSGLSIASHPSTGAVAWSTTRAPSASDGEIMMVRVAGDGTLLDPATGMPVTNATLREQYAPCIAWDGAEFVTVFQDTRNNPDGIFFFPRSDVFGARVGADGVVLDPGGGFAIEATPVPETQPAVAGEGGESLVVASRLIYGTAGALRLGLRGMVAPEPALPPVTGLRVVRGGGMTWDPLVVSGYDVLRGRLSDLHRARSIVDGACLREDVLVPSSLDAELPGAGDGFWYVVRADDVPGGVGTYDEPDDPTQGRLRDPDAGPLACDDSR